MFDLCLLQLSDSKLPHRIAEELETIKRRLPDQRTPPASEQLLAQPDALELRDSTGSAMRSPGAPSDRSSKTPTEAVIREADSNPNPDAINAECALPTDER